LPARPPLKSVLPSTVTDVCAGIVEVPFAFLLSRPRSMNRPVLGWRTGSAHAAGPDSEARSRMLLRFRGLEPGVHTVVRRRP
jgi:hypothetical protein